MSKHLAIFTPEVVKRVFAGKKTIESRFSKKRIPPFGQISIGDIVYIKPAGGDIKGRFRVKKVVSFEGLGENEWKMIRSNYGKRMSLGNKVTDETFLNGKIGANYGTIIFIDKLEQFITSPIKIAKKDLRAWVVLG